MKELKSVSKLIESFSRLPGIGHKSAEKMAYSVLELEDEDVEMFSDALKEVKRNVHHCSICGTYTEDDVCEICGDDNRDKTKIIVVSYPKDVASFEKLGVYSGRYHVLGGVLSAVNGVGINDLNISDLQKRIKEDGVKEIIIATNPTTEGETTALYLARILEKENVEVTRLAYGLPMGGHLEYADSLTLSKALEGRKKI
jgi:recombination protein RecR